MQRPNILFIMTDNQRADTLAALGNPHIYTPNLDRLARRGVAFPQAITPIPVCVPARYVVRTGCLPPSTRCFQNADARPLAQQPASMEERCGPYLARHLGHLGYRTFGVGKFHPKPWHEDLGYQSYQPCQELYGDAAQRSADGYATWLAREHPSHAWLEALHGERGEQFFVPQLRPLPARLTNEWWTTDRAIEQLQVSDDRPFFGFVSFIGPHAPFAPPQPFNRAYDPDRLPDPIVGDLANDYCDDQIATMTRALWAEDLGGIHARKLKARYYGTISFIDHCVGRLLEALAARGDADNTVIAFFADHGEHLGDHHAWHMDGFFDSSCRIPFLLSWPARLPANQVSQELVSLVDLFGIASHAAGAPEPREGVDLLAVLAGQAVGREHAIGMQGWPGKRGFKVMVRNQQWKYIFLANGGREQLFDLSTDPHELHNLADAHPTERAALYQVAVAACRHPGAAEALAGDSLRAWPFQAAPPRRILQFDQSLGLTGFPNDPGELLRDLHL